ncbi:MAG: ribulose phosphate epimerase [Nannocystaceae bacterium]
MRSLILLSMVALATASATACGDDATPSEQTSGPSSSGSSTSPTGGPALTTDANTSTATVAGTTADPATGSGSDETATDGFFVGDPDMGGGGGDCDVFAQDCPEGEKCMPWAADGGQSWNATTCRPVVRSPGQAGDPCTVEGSAVSGVDDCDVGTMCYSVSAKTNMGTCFELCGGSPDAPTCDEGLCAVYNDGNLPLCLTDCDPLLQDCGPEQLCLASPSANGFVCILDSLPFSDGSYGQPCEFVNTCDPGLFCAVQSIVAGCSNASGCCAEFCDLSAPDPDAQCTGQGAGEQCQPWYGMEPPPPGYEDVGFCGIP